MFEFITEWIDELEWDKVGWSLILWAACLLVLWKLMYDPKFPPFVLKIILSVVMLPISYVIMLLMTRN